MPFTKQKKVSSVSICLFYAYHTDEETGGATDFQFPMRRQTSGEADQDMAALSAGQLTELDRFCKLLVSEPKGFGDFPNDERPISERAKEYFSDEDIRYFVSDAMTAYKEVASPRAFFLTT
ncbi:MAG TPA: hypothetical protein VLR90_05415 [Blastocatellia bacterium]|nr:hypothetical protein [Blastocatellia bacterium]